MIGHFIIPIVNGYIDTDGVAVEPITIISKDSASAYVKLEHTTKKDTWQEIATEEFEQFYKSVTPEPLERTPQPPQLTDNQIIMLALADIYKKMGE